MTHQKDSGSPDEFGQRENGEPDVELTVDAEREARNAQHIEAERYERLDVTLAAITLRMGQCQEIVKQGREIFDESWILRNAAHSTLMQIGEATKDLPNAFRSAMKDVSWRAMIRTRDKTAHQYDQIDWDIVWVTISRDIPQDHERVRKIQADRAPGTQI